MGRALRLLPSILVGATCVLSLSPAASRAAEPAIGPATNVVARERLARAELAVLDRLDRWMALYDSDAGRMCEEIYTEDTEVWMPGWGLWFKDRELWRTLEIALLEQIRASGRERASRFRTVLVRHGLAAVEAEAGWAALLFFESSEGKVFLDRTYAAGREPVDPAATSLLVSGGSLPRAQQAGFAGAAAEARANAIESRDSVALGHRRMRALGTKIAGVDQLTAEERANLEAVLRWSELYNSDPARLVDALYAEDFESIEVGKPGRVYRDRPTWRALQVGIHQAFPERRMQLITVVPRGDMVAVEGVTRFDADHEEWWLGFLTLADGRIRRERRYDATEFRPDSELGRLVARAVAPIE